MKKKMPANLRKLLEWLDRASPLLETQIVADGLSHTLDKALMRNFAEMNLRAATVSITARGRDALSKFPVTCLPTSPRISDWETAASLPAYRRRLPRVGRRARGSASTSAHQSSEESSCGCDHER